MEIQTSTLSNCKESVVEDEVAQWLHISEQVEKAEAIAEKKAAAKAEAQAIIDWYNFHSTPGARMYHGQYLAEQEIIVEKRRKKIAAWYEKEGLAAIHQKIQEANSLRFKKS
jgi:hypothetical protein